jgi:3-oxoacyl-[acyl-carrier-protein] synthase III
MGRSVSDRLIADRSLSFLISHLFSLDKKMRNAIILSTGMYVPELLLPNSYFDEQLGINVSSWLEESANIYQRHWCRENESTADLCVAAAEQALERADLGPEALDLIIIATDTPEFVSPATASVVQHRLGAKNAGTFDLNTACAGFVTGVDIAATYLRAQPRYRHILVIGAYAMSKYLNQADKKTVTLFADGAGAMILAAKEEAGDQGYLASNLSAQGQYFDGMGIYAGGTHQPVDEAALANHDHQLKFVYKFPPDLNQVEWTRMIHELSAQSGVTPEAVDHYFITQINVNSIRATMDGLGLPQARAHTIMDRFGYTGSACIPMALHDAIERGTVRRGEGLFLVGSGGGLSFASAAFRY